MYADATAKPALMSFRYALWVRRGPRAVFWWGHVRPGRGPRVARIAVRGPDHRWRPLDKPFLTDGAGYFSGAAHADPNAGYRLEVQVRGAWRTGQPVHPL
jgi:hypothetical protein